MTCMRTSSPCFARRDGVARASRFQAPHVQEIDERFDCAKFDEPCSHTTMAARQVAQKQQHSDQLALGSGKQATRGLRCTRACQTVCERLSICARLLEDRQQLGHRRGFKYRID